MFSSTVQGLANKTLARGQEGQKTKTSSSSMPRRPLFPRRSTPSVSAAAAAPPARPREEPSRCRRRRRRRCGPSPLAPQTLIPVAAVATAADAASEDAVVAPIDHVQAALADLEDESLVVFAATAPAVRVAIGEALAQATGKPSTAVVQPGQLVAALRLLGFDRVFDVATGADLTVMEEGYELLSRLAERAEALAAAGDGETEKAQEGRMGGEESGRRSESGRGSGSSSRSSSPSSPSSPPHHLHGPLPMFTSCCPGWVSLVESAAPELLPHVSSCKSPHLMLGAVLKKYFAPKVLGIDPRKVRVVSVMPCLKKQAEADRPGNQWEGMRDVDHVVTTRELAEVLKQRGIVDLGSLPISNYDDPLAPSSTSPSPSSSQTGSGVLFGTTGGVMEAALRTVYEAVTGQRLARLEFEECRVRF